MVYNYNINQNFIINKNYKRRDSFFFLKLLKLSIRFSNGFKWYFT